MLLLLINLVLFLFSIYLIMVGSDWITDSSVHVAHRLGTSKLAVGLIVISFLLSLPELVIAVSSIAKGHAAFGFGASIGSVIVNIGLIVGISALIRPMRIPRIMVTRDMIFMTVVSIVVVALALGDRYLSKSDGVVLLLLFIPYVINVYEQERNLTTNEKKIKAERMTETLQMYGDYTAHPSHHLGFKYFFLGAVFLLVGSEVFLRVLLNAAESLSLPELLIGVTLGALGPSIPTLAASLGAARKGVEELVISETIGSNIFTLLITLGIIAILSPVYIDDVTAWVTAPALLLITFILLFAMLRGHIGRRGGLLLVMIYITTLIAEFIFRQ
ncbi:MAG: sodium:calcium antiporter [Candidatus Altiarchaeota archaeon]